MRGSSRYPIFYALAAAALFGAATPLSKLLLQDIPPFQLAGLFYIGAAIGVAGAAYRSHGQWSWGATNMQKLLGAIGFGGVFGPVLLLLGLRVASAASVSLWLNAEIVATALLGRWLFHDHLGRRGCLGVAGVTGAGVLLSVAEGSSGVVAGLLVVAACCCWALDNHLTATIDGIAPAQVTFWKGVVAGSVNLLIGVVVAPYTSPPLVTGAALAVGALSYGASIALYITAAQQLGATRGQMLFATAPFFGLAVSVVVLGEPVSLLQLAAGALFFVSVVVVFLDQHAHPHEHQAVAHAHMHQHDDGHHTHTHPGEPLTVRHSHSHEHSPATHAHPHLPDIHHRHPHSL